MDGRRSSRFFESAWFQRDASFDLLSSLCFILLSPPCVAAVSAPHSLSPYFAFLKTAGSYCVVGVPPESFAVNPGELIFKRIKLGTCTVLS